MSMVSPMKFVPNHKRRRWATKADIGEVLTFIKRKIGRERDDFKKQAWAEVGLELNKMFLHLGK